MAVGHVWYGLTQLLPQVAPQRQVNLDDPYIGLEDLSTGCGCDFDQDYCPRVGESGIRFYYRSRTDLSGATATAAVHGPFGTEYYHCRIASLDCPLLPSEVSFVSQSCTFQVAGRHRVVLTVQFPGGGRRKICRTIYVEDC